MKPTHKILRPPSVAAATAERSLARAPRFALSAKTGLPVVTSNRSFIQSWMARRAKLVAAARARTAK